MHTEKTKTRQKKSPLEPQFKLLLGEIAKRVEKREFSSLNSNENLRIACYFLREILTLLDDK